MEEISKASTDNATSSWYGFESQGRIGLLYFLKHLNSLEQNEWNQFVLEYEYMEDFSIAKIGEENNIFYKSIYQVKARESLSKDDIKKVYGELGFKQSIYNDAEVYLITRCEVNEAINSKAEIEWYINRHLIETKLLYNYNDLEKIRKNLKLKGESEIPIIRKTVRNKFKEFRSIDSVEKIKEYCEELLQEYEKYKENIEDRDIKVINLDFDKINSSICDNIKEIMAKVDPNAEYKQKNGYIDKVRNALIYLLSSNLEQYVLEKNQITFTITSKELIQVIKSDQSKIDELQYLYLTSKKLEYEFVEYCDYQCSKDENDCDECALNLMVQKMRWISLNELKSMLLNSNPHININVDELDFNTITKLLDSSKLENFIFDEIKKNKYDIQAFSEHVYLKSINEKHLFSFIDYEDKKKDLLLKKLDENALNNIHIYNDNEIMLNKNLNFKYNLGETLSINQHWNNENIEEKEKIISSSIELKKFDN